jgi:hypothetical protein
MIDRRTWKKLLDNFNPVVCDACRLGVPKNAQGQHVGSLDITYACPADPISEYLKALQPKMEN